jgi:hypothetical protein
MSPRFHEKFSKPTSEVSILGAAVRGRNDAGVAADPLTGAARRWRQTSSIFGTCPTAAGG